MSLHLPLLKGCVLLLHQLVQRGSLLCGSTEGTSSLTTTLVGCCLSTFSLLLHLISLYAVS
jgi:hypothetical protein